MQALPKKPSAKKVWTPSNYPLPSERFSFPTHLEVVRRSITASSNGTKTISAKETEDGIVLPRQATQLNTGFLTDIGLLTEVSRGKFKPTPAAIQFTLTRAASPERAVPILRELVDRSWFAATARSLLGSKPLVTEQELIAELAIAAQTDLKKKEDSIRVLVEYLTFTGIVARTEQGLMVGSGSASPSSGSAPPAPEPSPSSYDARIAISAAPTVLPAELAGWETIQRNEFYLRIRKTPVALGRLRRQIDLLELELREGIPPIQSPSTGASEGVGPGPGAG